MNFYRRHKTAFAVLAGISIWAVLVFAQAPRFFPGPYNTLFRVMTATDTATLTTSQMFPGLLIGTPTAAANYTTPTATQFCTSFPSVAIQAPGTNTNFGYDLKIRNTSGGANTITLVAGTGVTLATGNTNTIAQNHTRTFVIVPTVCGGGNNAGATPAVTIYSAQDSAH